MDRTTWPHAGDGSASHQAGEPAGDEPSAPVAPQAASLPEMSKNVNKNRYLSQG